MCWDAGAFQGDDAAAEGKDAEAVKLEDIANGKLGWERATCCDLRSDRALASDTEDKGRDAGLGAGVGGVEGWPDAIGGR